MLPPKYTKNRVKFKLNLNPRQLSNFKSVQLPGMVNMKILCFILMCAVSVAYSQSPRGKKGDTKPMMQRQKMMEDLNLTEEQQAQVRKIRSDVQREQISLRAKIQTLRLDVRDLFAEIKPDKSKIDTKITEIGRLQNEMKLNHVSAWFGINKLLTPEQQKIWKKYPLMMGQGNSGGGFRRHMRGILGMRETPDDDIGTVPDGIENVEE